MILWRFWVRKEGNAGVLVRHPAESLGSSAAIELYPLKFRPILKEKVWGGTRLGEIFGKPIPPGSLIGESWEISDREGGMSIVAAGPLAGKSLHELLAAWRVEILGEVMKSSARFPLLLKFLDAGQDLSVQVHPDDVYALRAKENDAGKTEAWYVISARPGGAIIRGLKLGTSRQAFRQLLEEGRLEECLHRFPVQGGETIFLPAGTVHALCSGVVLAEIQQNSDLTYRVYDWNRLGLDGKPRPLHVEKALDVIAFDRPPKGPETPRPLGEYRYLRERLVACDKFILDRLVATEKVEEETDGARFLILCAIRGASKLRYGPGGREEVSVTGGDSFLLPARLGRFSLDASGRLEALLVTPQ